MKIFKTAQLQQQFAKSVKKNAQTIAFVPTMGFLHDGHLSLVKLARQKADVVVVSIFVNPKQFNNPNDLETYPVDLKADLQKLKQENVDAVFLPTAKNLYPKNYQTYVDVEELTKPLCGLTRPGHFKGVTTIVLKLLNIVQPDFAIFGKKDYQQFKVIERMCLDLNMPVKIIGAPLKRTPQGLAMSSRHVRLTAEHRQQAVCLYTALKGVSEKARQASLSLSALKKNFLKQLPQSESIKIDYVEFLDSQTLQPLRTYLPKKTLLAVACFFGEVRLIDNIVF